MTIKPTNEQIKIIFSEAKSIFVEANAGAAKTTTAAMRIKELINRRMSYSLVLAKKNLS